MVLGMKKKEEPFEDFQKLPEEFSISFSMINNPVYTKYLHHLLDLSCFYYAVGKVRDLGSLLEISGKFRPLFGVFDQFLMMLR